MSVRVARWLGGLLTLTCWIVGTGVLTAASAPSVSIDGGTPTTDDTPTITWTSAGDGNGTFNYYLQTATGSEDDVDTADTSVTLGPLDEGSYVFHIAEYDVDGETLGTATSLVFEIDLTGPSAPTVSLSNSSPTSDTTPTWTWTGAESGGSYELAIDDADLSGDDVVSTSDLTYTATTDLADGTHTLYVRQLDDLGNAGDIGSADVVIDTGPPTITIADPLPIGGSGATVTVTITSDESVTGMAVGDLTYSDGSVSDFTEIDDTSWTVTVTLPSTTGDTTLSMAADAVTDAAGTGNEAASGTIRVDATLDAIQSAADVVSFTLATANSETTSAIGLGSFTVVTYNPSTETYDTVTTLEPGVGYFFDPAGSATIGLTVEPYEGDYAIAVDAGWNQVGLPYLEDLAWDLDAIMVTSSDETTMTLREAVEADLIEDYAWYYDADTADYQAVLESGVINDSVDTIPAWTAFWILVLEDGVTVTFPEPAMGSS